MSSLSIILIGHNGSHFLPKCLAAISAQKKRPMELIYIDSGSEDNSSEVVLSHYPTVKLIEKKENLGYSKAANIGINASNTEYVMILNPDVFLGPDYSKHCLATLEANPSSAGVTGKIFQFDYQGSQKTNIIDSTGLESTKGGQFIDRGGGYADIGQFGQVEEVFGVSGCCPVFRRTALDASKVFGEYFDEDFFMYKDDVDLCWRLQILRWTFLYTPYAIAYHVRGTGVYQRNGLVKSIRARQRLNGLQRYYSFKNHRLMVLKNLVPAYLVRFPFIAMREIAAIIWALMFEAEARKALPELLRQIPVTLSKRREIVAKYKASAGNGSHIPKARDNGA